MSRCDLYLGLNKWAQKLVTRQTRVASLTLANGETLQLPHPLKIAVVEKKAIATISGTYKDEVAKLYRYTFPSGLILEEYLQEKFHCGGPNYFIALRRLNGKPVKKSIWTNEEMGLPS
jgi:hypothetical protein